MIKRKKATIEQIEGTRRTQGAKEQMYRCMAEACIKALINREMDILITFPYFVKFKSEGYPRGVLVSKTLTANTYKVKTRKLLDWLYSNGYSKHNSEAVMKASRNFNDYLTRMTNKFDLDGSNEETQCGIQP